MPPKPENTAALAATLTRFDAQYDPAVGLPSEVHKSPGYHTTVPNGVTVHATRTGLDYALAQLASGEPNRVARAHRAIAIVLSLQDTDPLSATYGIWPWLYEEPLAQMDRPDWNWADFLGARLAVALIRFPDRLPADLAQRMRASLHHAAMAIFRRNVTVAYTNIALMGAAVTAMAGELLDRPELLAYGRRRLRGVLEHAQTGGGFAEYNSPTYSLVAVDELDRVLRFVRDGETRELAATLHAQVWQMIAEHFHAPTQQWAGPHARAYHDHLTDAYTAHLASATGLPLRYRVEREGVPGGAALEPAPAQWRAVEPTPCPAALLPLFTRRDDEPRVVRSEFSWQSDGTQTVGTTWFHGDACLGSVNQALYWTQTRSLIGYWPAERDPAVALRMRFLKDGRDFSSMKAHQAQSGPRVLATAFPIRGGGDFHIHLDCPPDNVFHGRELVWRLELRGVGVAAERVGESTFALSAGAWKAVLHALPGEFAGRAVTWRLGEGDRVAWVEAVCHESPEPAALDFKAITGRLAAGIEVLPIDAPPSASPRGSGDRVAWDVAGLDIGA